MRKVSIIGIGAGDPRHMTVQAIEALNAVDVVFLLDKGRRKPTSRTFARQSARATSRSPAAG